jgi:hypothetical protein
MGVPKYGCSAEDRPHQGPRCVRYTVVREVTDENYFSPHRCPILIGTAEIGSFGGREFPVQEESTISSGESFVLRSQTMLTSFPIPYPAMETKLNVTAI